MSEITLGRAGELLRHALGLDQSKKPYRNYYVAGPRNEPECRELVTLGYMQLADDSGEWPVFTVTTAGESFLGLPPRTQET
jgi:hypothetical protein